jgi:L-fuculose-phosphate aldolase
MSAIVHAHPRFATTLSALVKEVPAIHHEMADLGWPLRVAEYGRFGSQQLADQTVAALGDRNAVLMKNHGMVAVAGDAGAALGRALATEWVCEVFYRALLVGEPALLPEGELAAVSEERSAAEGGGPGFPFDTSYLDKAGWR